MEILSDMHKPGQCKIHRQPKLIQFRFRFRYPLNLLRIVSVHVCVCVLLLLIILTGFRIVCFCGQMKLCGCVWCDMKLQQLVELRFGFSFISVFLGSRLIPIVTGLHSAGWYPRASIQILDATPRYSMYGHVWSIYPHLGSFRG